ncbi:hypothetical protein [Halobacillus sp. A5]|uniref:hypothetical protein n=1 Tax=Halobacillus sp. A5 TaxID=2880263 RepID=UPI0020A61E8B|nr:hypothetical protein [Halobacillus sp. A5]MCP3027632.1 hypothetical protein [Halobacillus sp. A5]
MRHEEAADVLETIEELFGGKFVITERKIEVFIPQLMKMEYKPVMEKVFDYASRYPFPPTLADIAVYPPQSNDYLKKKKQWDEEAAQVPEETKRRFEEKFAALLKKVSR